MKKIVSIATVALALGVTSLNADILAELTGPGTGNSNTGCGLGSVLIKKQDSVLLQLVASVLNGTSGNQTFGITTGTSGCKRTKLVLNDRAQEFIAGNMDQLSREIAQGHGESVTTLAELLEVSDVQTFAANLQSNYNAIYSSADIQMSDVAANISTAL